MPDSNDSLPRFICARCGGITETPEKVAGAATIMFVAFLGAAFLWFLAQALFPEIVLLAWIGLSFGVFAAALRFVSPRTRCGLCWSEALLPGNSPVGRELFQKYHDGRLPADPAKTDTERMKKIEDGTKLF